MSASDESLADVVQAQAALIADLQARLDRLETKSTPRSQGAPASVMVSAVDGTVTDSTSRRGFLRLAGVAAAGAAVAVVATATPAAAVDGGTFNGVETVFNNNGTDVNKAGVHGTFSPNGGGIGVLGTADLGASAAGVLGTAALGYGVYGTSSSGYALYAGSNGRLGFDPHLAGTTAPTSNAYKLGDIVMNANGDTFSCVVAGSGGTARWRKLAGPLSAGQLHLLPSVQRVVYTGTGTGIAAGTLGANTNRITANLATALSVPTVELNGALASVTVYPPGASGNFASSGYLGVAGVYTATPSVTFAAGQAFQTGLVATNFNNGTIVLAAFGAACEVTVDIIGYYR